MQGVGSHTKFDDPWDCLAVFPGEYVTISSIFEESFNGYNVGLGESWTQRVSIWWLTLVAPPNHVSICSFPANIKITPCTLTRKSFQMLSFGGGKVRFGSQREAVLFSQTYLKCPDACLLANVSCWPVRINAVLMGPYSASTDFFHYIKSSFMIV